MKRYLIREIERLREEMVKKGNELGIDHPEVLEISRKIDLLHTQLLRIQIEKNYKQKKDNSDTIFESNSMHRTYYSTHLAMF